MFYQFELDTGYIHLIRIDSAGAIHEEIYYYASTGYVDNSIENALSIFNPDIDLSDYATKGYVDDAVDNIDLSGYATETYVSQEISKMVDSAPETLNTLNELAAALGDDPNFATTVSNRIGSLETKVGNKSVAEQIDEALEEFEGALPTTPEGGNILGDATTNTSEGAYTLVAGQSNTALGDHSVAMGEGVQTGCKGYYIKAIDPANRYIYLATDGVECIPTWNNPSSYYEISYVSDYVIISQEQIEAGDFPAYVNEFSISSEDYYHWVFAADIVDISGNRIQYSEKNIMSENPDKEHAAYKKWMSNFEGKAKPMKFYVPTQSEAGNIITGHYTLAVGKGSVAADDYAVSEGRYNLAVGYAAHVEGDSNRAGYTSHAEGVRTQALGLGAHTEGQETIATGRFAHAQGSGSEATGDFAHAEGYYTKATGNYSHAQGSGSEASGMHAHAEGTGSIASGAQSHAQGYHTEASGRYSHAGGKETKASGTASTATGNGAVAFSKYSHAFGYKTQTGYPGSLEEAELVAPVLYEIDQHPVSGTSWEQLHVDDILLQGNENVILKFDIEGVSTGPDYAEQPYVIFNFISYDEANNAIETVTRHLFQGHYDYSLTTPENTHHVSIHFDWTDYFDGYVKNVKMQKIEIKDESVGQAAFAIGYETNALGNQSFAGGLRSIAKGSAAFAFGNDVTASANQAIAMGNNTTASKTGAVALGADTTASGKYSIALGKNTEATMPHAFANGINTKATQSHAIALGSNSNAKGIASLAFGDTNNAEKAYTWALGQGNTVNAIHSLAVGRDNTTNGRFNFAFGEGNTTNGDYAVAIGANATANEKTTVIKNDKIRLMGNDIQIKDMSLNAQGLTVDTEQIRLNSWHTLDLFGHNISIGEEIFHDEESTPTISDFISLKANNLEMPGFSALAAYTHEENGEGWLVPSTVTIGEGYDLVKMYGGGNGIIIDSPYLEINNGEFGVNINVPHITIHGNTLTFGEDSQAQGQCSLAFGTSAEAIADHSLAFGDGATALGAYSLAFGSNAVTDGEGNIAIGINAKASASDTIALGHNAKATVSGAIGIGSYVTSNSPYTIAIGYNCNANKSYSVAIGSNNTASAAGAFALGYSTTAGGKYSATFGQNTSTAAEGAIAFGNTSKANVTSNSGAYNSLVGGYYSESSHNATIVVGNQLRSANINGAVFGQYNSIEGLGTTANDRALLILGNGSSDATRSNAFVVLRDGRMILGSGSHGTALPASGYEGQIFFLES